MFVSIFFVFDRISIHVSIFFCIYKQNCFYGSFDLFKTDNNKTNIL